MMKSTVKTLRVIDHYPQGYGYMGYPPEDGREVWQKVVEVCNENNGKYLKHFVYDEWKHNKEYKDHETKGLKISSGDLTIYLEVFYEV